jgi:hypothetical protein
LIAKWPDQELRLANALKVCKVIQTSFKSGTDNRRIEDSLPFSIEQFERLEIAHQPNGTNPFSPPMNSGKALKKEGLCGQKVLSAER